MGECMPKCNSPSWDKPKWEGGKEIISLNCKFVEIQNSKRR